MTPEDEEWAMRAVRFDEYGDVGVLRVTGSMIQSPGPARSSSG